MWLVKGLKQQADKKKECHAEIIVTGKRTTELVEEMEYAMLVKQSNMELTW